MERHLNPGHPAPAAVFLSTLQGEPCDQGPFLLYYFMLTMFLFSCLDTQIFLIHLFTSQYNAK